MPIIIEAKQMREILPRAPQSVIDAYASPEGQRVLDKAGITETRNRFSVALSQVEHECDGYTIKSLTENINYSAARAVDIWPYNSKAPHRTFKSEADVYAKCVSFRGDPQFKFKLMNLVYGGRMGNRPGTADGSLFIGHGGPQWTGRDGHEALARILKTLVPGLPANLTAEEVIAYAISYEMQPAVLAAFWIWKNLNPICDAGGLRAVTKPWNGGYIGMADREAKLKGNDPIVARMKIVERVLPIAKNMPGGPSTPVPPKEVIDATTVNERRARAGGAATAATGGAGEATKASTEMPAPATMFLSPVLTYTLIGVGVAVALVAAVLIARKKASVVANWF